jgi:hypothetical protein
LQGYYLSQPVPGEQFERDLLSKKYPMWEGRAKTLPGIG